MKTLLASRDLVCPVCQCRHFELVAIRKTMAMLRRRKACRNCGRCITTCKRITDPENTAYKGPDIDVN